MDFSIESGTEEVWSCDECIYVSIKKHFSDGPVCPLCRSESTKLSEQERSTGMSEYRYMNLLDNLEENAAGIGAGTVENIREHFEDGDDFLDAAEDAYQEKEWAALTDVSGVGESSAESIALTMAMEEDWSGGKAEMKFDF